MAAGVYSNRFTVTVMGEGNVKIEFGEAGAGGDIFHQAVVLHVTNAQALSDLLRDLIAQATRGGAPEPQAAGGIH